MRRSFICFCLVVAFGCRDRNYSKVSPAPPELVDISLDENDERLSFLLPDLGWRQVRPDGAFKGLLYESGGRRLGVKICLKESEFQAASAKARKQADGAEIRAFEPGPHWPFVGVIVSYRGPPDVQMLDAFVRSFRVERR
jgi:hypothetical protein